MKKVLSTTIILVIITGLTYGQRNKVQFVGHNSNVHLKHLNFEEKSKESTIFKFFSQDRKITKKNDTGTQFFTKATKHRLDSLVYEYWVSGQWVNAEKVNYSYDANGNMTQAILNWWDEALDLWMAYHKNEIDYDLLGNIVQVIFSEFDSGALLWLNMWKIEMSYDTNGYKTEWIDYLWNDISNQWQQESKIGYFYDTVGNLTVTFSYFWDGIASQWIEYRKEEYSYDALGHVMLRVLYEWNDITNQWENLFKKEYTYDASGNEIQEINYFWDSYYDSVWIKTNKYDNDYDANGNKTESIWYSWDQFNNQWYPNRKNQNVYDLLYSITDLIMPPAEMLFNETFINMPLNFTEYINTGGNWVNDLKGTYYFSTQNTSVINIEEDKVYVYPNPASDYLYISFADNSKQVIFELYDMQGRKVMSQGIHRNEMLLISSLNAGMYFYKLNIDGKEYKGKLIKNK